MPDLPKARIRVFIAAIIALLAATTAHGQENVRVEVRGLQKAAPGADLHVGPSWSLRAAPGHVVWGEDGTSVKFSAPREDLRIQVGDSLLALGPGETRIESSFVLRTPNVDLVARRGSVSIEGSTIHVRVVSQGGMSGRGAWAMAVGMGLVVLVLMRRASLVQRSLDRPRTSVRSRTGRSGGRE